MQKTSRLLVEGGKLLSFQGENCCLLSCKVLPHRAELKTEVYFECCQQSPCFAVTLSRNRRPQKFHASEHYAALDLGNLPMAGGMNGQNRGTV